MVCYFTLLKDKLEHLANIILSYFFLETRPAPSKPVVSPGRITGFKLSLWLRTNGWIFMPFSIHISGMARIILVKFQAIIRRFRRILANFRPKSVIFSPTENSAKILEKTIL